MQPQWEIELGAFAVAQSALTEAEKRFSVVRDLPRVLYDEAPGAYTRRVLEEMDEAVAWILWARRVVIDEALQQRTLPLRAVANASGIAVSTLQKWKASPLAALDHEEGPVTGPGDRSERRKGDY